MNCSVDYSLPFAGGVYYAYIEKVDNITMTMADNIREGIKIYMCIESICKKICFMLVLVGLILCSGKCVYAHSDELIEAIAASSKDPTIENLEHLVCLFEKDVEYHQSRGENIEANKSKAMVFSIKANIAIESQVNPTEEVYEKIISLLRSETELWRNIKDYASLKNSLIRMKQCEVILCSLRADNAILRAQESPTIENLEMASKLSKEESLLYYEIGDTKLAEYCLAQSIYFKAIKYLYRAKENSTIENWTKTAKLFNEAVRIYCKIGITTVAKVCAQELPYVNRMIKSFGGTPS